MFTTIRPQDTGLVVVNILVWYFIRIVILFIISLIIAAILYNIILNRVLQRLNTSWQTFFDTSIKLMEGESQAAFERRVFGEAEEDNQYRRDLYERIRTRNAQVTISEMYPTPYDVMMCVCGGLAGTFIPIDYVPDKDDTLVLMFVMLLMTCVNIGVIPLVMRRLFKITGPPFGSKSTPSAFGWALSILFVAFLACNIILWVVDLGEDSSGNASNIINENTFRSGNASKFFNENTLSNGNASKFLNSITFSFFAIFGVGSFNALPKKPLSKFLIGIMLLVKRICTDITFDRAFIDSGSGKAAAVAKPAAAPPPK